MQSLPLEALERPVEPVDAGDQRIERLVAQRIEMRTRYDLEMLREVVDRGTGYGVRNPAVGNLPYDVTQQEVMQLFSDNSAGPVVPAQATKSRSGLAFFACCAATS